MATESSHHLDILDALKWDRRIAESITPDLLKGDARAIFEAALTIAVGAERRYAEERAHESKRNVAIRLDGETVAAAIERARSPMTNYRIDTDEPFTLTDLGMCTMHIRGADAVIAHRRACRFPASPFRGLNASR